MARATGISTAQLSRWWSEAGIQPHRVRTFRLSDDSRFKAKLRDVVAVLKKRVPGTVRLSVDENPDAGPGTHAGGPARAPGHAATRTHDYRHHSTLALLAALDLDTGQEVHLHFHFHFTPTYASWLNPVEYWFSALQRHVLAHSSFAGAGYPQSLRAGPQPPSRTPAMGRDRRCHPAQI